MGNTVAQGIRSRLALFLIAAATLTALLLAERATTLTTDEPLHLTRGVAWWQAPDTRLSWPHPPLAHIVTGAPAALVRTGPPIEQLRGYSNANMPRASMAYFQSYDQARHELRVARWMMIALTLLMTVYLYEWTRRRYGPRLAWMVTLLFVANPVLLAHAKLVTTDVPVALVTLFSVLQLHDYLLSRSRLALLGLMVGVAGLVTVKLTGALIAFILLLPAVLFAIAGRGRFSGAGPKRRFLLLARDVLLTAMVALFAINAVYRFDDTGLTVAEISEHPAPPGKMLRELDEKSPLLRMVPSWMPIPVPYTYLFSLEYVRSHNRKGHSSYFRGKQRSSGTPGYFPIMLGAKLPAGMLLLLVAGVVLAAKRRLVGVPFNVWLHAYVASAYLLLTFNAHINIGVRHALPAVPSLAFLAAHAANALWAAGHVQRAFAAVCLVSVVAGTLLAHPRYIGDFNWFVGGRTGGHRLSVVGEDWGQDLNELAHWQEQNGVPISYYHWQSLRYQELEYLGAEVRRWKCSGEAPDDHWLALHLSERLRSGRCIEQFEGREPDVVLNDHILLYSP